MSNYSLTPGFDPGFFVGTQPELSKPFEEISNDYVRLHDAVITCIKGQMDAIGLDYKKLVERPASIVGMHLDSAVVDADKIHQQITQAITNDISAIVELGMQLPKAPSMSFLSGYDSGEIKPDTITKVASIPAIQPMANIAGIRPQIEQSGIIANTFGHGDFNCADTPNALECIQARGQLDIGQGGTNTFIDTRLDDIDAVKATQTVATIGDIGGCPDVSGWNELQADVFNRNGGRNGFYVYFQDGTPHCGVPNKGADGKPCQPKFIATNANQSGTLNDFQQSLVSVFKPQLRNSVPCVEIDPANPSCQNAISGEIIWPGLPECPAQNTTAGSGATCPLPETLKFEIPVCPIIDTKLKTDPVFVAYNQGDSCGVDSYKSSATDNGRQLAQDIAALHEIWRNKIAEIKPSDSGPFGNAIGGMIWAGISQLMQSGVSVGETLVQSFNALPDVFGCSGGGQQVPRFAAMSAAGFADKWLGGPWDYLVLPEQYKFQRDCPLIMPSVDGAKAAYLGNEITLQQLQNWVAINGRCWEPFERELNVAKSKPIPPELIAMLRRGIIDEEQYASMMRKLGYVDKTYPQQILQASYQLPLYSDLIQLWRRETITHGDFLAGMKSLGFTLGDSLLLESLGTVTPPPSDLTTFMTRDVADMELVEKFGMDADFTKKFTGDVKRWAKWNGMSDDYMRAVWRAHWKIPAPGQLFEMLHRNSRLPKNDPAYVDIDDVRTALEQQDILPFWIPKFLAISYRPLTRVDVRRAFDIGAMKREQVKESYLQAGYNDDNAEILTKFAEKLKLRNGKNHPTVKGYIRGEVGTVEMEADLRDSGYADPDIQRLNQYAVRKFKTINQVACKKGIRKRFMLGELTAADSRVKLVDTGLDALQADMVVAGWACERDAIGKQIPATTLAKWLELGLINANEFVKRLKALGYTDDDAMTSLIAVQRNIAGRLQRAAEKQAREQAAKEKADQAAIDKAKAKLARDIEKGNKAAQAAQAAQIRRDKALVAASDKLSRACDLSIDDSFGRLKAIYARLRSEYDLSVDECIQAIVLAVEKYSPDDDCQIEQRIIDVAEAMIDAATISAE